MSQASPTSLHKKAMEVRKWEDLPIDCVGRVFQRVGLTLLYVPLVCKSWHQASRDSELWKSIDFSTAEASSELIKYMVYRSHGTAVDFTFPRSCSAKDIAYVSERCPLLNYVKLPIVVRGPCQDKEVWRPVGKWKDLHHLEVGTNFWGNDIILVVGRRCKNFRGFTYSGVFDGNLAYRIGGWIPCIKYLRVTKGSLVTWSSIGSLVHWCKELEEVDISNCSVVLSEVNNIESTIESFIEKKSSMLKKAPHLKILTEGIKIVGRMEYYDIARTLNFPALEG